MTEGNIFSLFTPKGTGYSDLADWVLHPSSTSSQGDTPILPDVCGGGEGTPYFRMGGGMGTPCGWCRGGLLHLADGGTPSGWQGQVTPSGWWRILFGTPPHLDWMGVLPSHQDWMGYPHWDWIRVPPLGLNLVAPGQDWMGVHLPPIRREISRVSTCYAAGGMPLAFMQEDLLVFHLILFRTTFAKPKRVFTNSLQYKKVNITNLVSAVWAKPMKFVTLDYNPHCQLISNFTFTKITWWYKYKGKLQMFWSTKLSLMPVLPILYVCEQGLDRKPNHYVENCVFLPQHLRKFTRL